MFHTSALSFVRLEMQLFTVTPRGESPERLPLADGSDGAIDETGTWLAYTPQWPNNLINHCKRYRGSAAPDIHLVNLLHARVDQDHDVGRRRPATCAAVKAMMNALAKR